MDFWIHFYCLLAFLTSLTLASNPKYELSSASRYTPDDKDLAILKRAYLDLGRTNKAAVEEASSGLSNEQKTASLNTPKPLDRKLYFSWWPSKVDFSAINEILEPSTAESLDRDAKKPVTFDELEKENANIYNPPPNPDHRLVHSKKYTFEELEDMNANRYNPYLN